MINEVILSPVIGICTPLTTYVGAELLYVIAIITLLLSPVIYTDPPFVL